MSELVSPSRVMLRGQSGLRHLAGAHGVLLACGQGLSRWDRVGCVPGRGPGKQVGWRAQTLAPTRLGLTSSPHP